jgi:hypothetical protein
MKELTIKVSETNYQTLMHLLKTLDYVTVVKEHKTGKKSMKPNYDFSDLAGKLEWKGDAIAEQKVLRNEW